MDNILRFFLVLWCEFRWKNIELNLIILMILHGKGRFGLEITIDVVSGYFMLHAYSFYTMPEYVGGIANCIYLLDPNKKGWLHLIITSCRW